MPCSPEIAPPSAMPAAKRSWSRSCARVGVGLEHRQVDVAVAGVAAADDPATRCASASSATAARYSGIGARGTTMSTMSSAPAAFATQNAFSRASMSCAPAPGGST